MYTVNTYYETDEQFHHSINAHTLIDNEQLLIQIFTAITDEHAILTMLQQITAIFPTASIIGATTDGEICSGRVSTNKTVVSFTQFENTTLKTKLIVACENSTAAGQKMASALLSPSTKLMITFTDGLHFNGEAYLEGINSVNADVVVAGGMAGDSGLFTGTYVFTRDTVTSKGAVGVALVNSELNVYTDHSFNWLPIGRSMTITKVDDNRVYTIDDMSAYDVYKKYLGPDVAESLPAIGIEFPLIIQKEDDPIARAVLSKYEDGSLSFAGAFKIGDRVRFGYGDAERILEHSMQGQSNLINKPIETIFIYSCMARRRFMPDLIGSEIEPFQAISEVAGFFTYGEFFSYAGRNELMNQTMTILAISESSELTPKKITKSVKKVSLNEYQKSIKALSHLLNVTTKELLLDNSELEERTEVIKAKSESMRRAQEIGHFGSWEIDLITQESIWSDESYHIYRMDPKTVKPTLHTFLDIVLEKDKPKVAETIASLHDGRTASVVAQVRRADGVVITVLVSGKMLFDEHNKPMKMIGVTLDITEKVRLKEQNADLVGIIEDSSNEIYIVEQDSYRYLYVNAQVINTLGFSQKELLQMTMLDINKNLSQENAKSLQDKLIADGTLLNRAVHTRKDGTTYPVQSYIQYRRYNNQDVAVIFAVDITDLIAAEQKQKQQALILQQIHDAVISTDLDGTITQWNHGATILHGYSAKEMIGRSIDSLYPADELAHAHSIVQQVLRAGACHDQIKNRTKNGDEIWTDTSLSLLKDEDGKVIGITRYSQDITRRKEIEDALKEQTKLLNFQAYHDTLTGLPNRALFEDRLEQSIVKAHRQNDKFGLLFIDLDNFKKINDTLGHHIGDEVLKITAKRLQACLREEDTLSRLGGDEFTILIQNLKTSDSAAKVAQKIVKAMEPRITVDYHELHITASVGISLYPDDSAFKNDLLKYADSAMYKAKDEGRNNYQFYSTDMTLMAFEKVVLESNLHNAIEQKQFIVYYQPQIDARSSSVVGMEALVRWQHPQMGMLMPDKFIALAEETGLITELDHYVMRQAMRDVSDWYRAGLNPGVLSLNLSIKRLMSPAFMHELTEALAETSFDLQWLEFEITESQVMLDPQKSIEILQAMSDMGIKIAIDDFGTGYSSLAYLKRLPVDKLKIDRSFVQDLPDDEEDRAISQAVIALAQSLHLTIIAEGVEKSEQITYLLSRGCYYFQGYYYSKAITKEEMTRYIENSEVVPLV